MIEGIKLRGNGESIYDTIIEDNAHIYAGGFQVDVSSQLSNNLIQNGNRKVNYNINVYNYSTSAMSVRVYMGIEAVSNRLAISLAPMSQAFLPGTSMNFAIDNVDAKASYGMPGTKNYFHQGFTYEGVYKTSLS